MFAQKFNVLKSKYQGHGEIRPLFKKIALSILVVGALVTISQPIVLADTSKAQITYHYVAENELSEAEKGQIVSTLPPTVEGDATYYMVYGVNTATNNDSNSTRLLPNTGSKSGTTTLLIIGLGLLTLLLVFKKRRGTRKFFFLIGTIGALTSYSLESVSAQAVQLLSAYSTSRTLTVGDKLPDGILTIEGYEFIGYIIGELNAKAEVPVTTLQTLEQADDKLTEASTDLAVPDTVSTTLSDQTGVQEGSDGLQTITEASSTIREESNPNDDLETDRYQFVFSRTTDLSSLLSSQKQEVSESGTSVMTEVSEINVINETTETTFETSDTDRSETTVTEPESASNETNNNETPNNTGTAASDALQLDISLGDNVTQTASLEVVLNQATVKNQAMTELANLRKDMYQNHNPKFNGTDLRSYLANLGITSAEQYASLFTWDNSLERIAIQRAVETGVHRQVGHLRANGESIFTAVDLRNGQGFNSEIIQWGFDTQEALSNPSGFAYGELKDLNSANGYANSANGHLHTLLDPSYTSYGFASISHPDFLYGQVTIGLARQDVSTNTEGTNLDGSYTITYASGN